MPHGKNVEYASLLRIYSFYLNCSRNRSKFFVCACMSYKVLSNARYRQYLRYKMLKKAASVHLLFSLREAMFLSSRKLSLIRSVSYSYMRRICSSGCFVLRRTSYASISNRKTIHHIARSGLSVKPETVPLSKGYGPSIFRAMAYVIHTWRVNASQREAS